MSVKSKDSNWPGHPDEVETVLTKIKESFVFPLGCNNIQEIQMRTVQLEKEEKAKVNRVEHVFRLVLQDGNKKVQALRFLDFKIKQATGKISWKIDFYRAATLTDTCSGWEEMIKADYCTAKETNALVELRKRKKKKKNISKSNLRTPHDLVTGSAQTLFRREKTL